MCSQAKHPARVFFGVSSFQILAMFRRGLFYSYLSIYLRHFLGLSVTETTFFATFPMILNILFQTFVWGVLSDKHQLRRTLIVRGELLAGIGTMIVWYAHTLTTGPVKAGYVIIIGLSIIEIFWSMSNIGWSALLSDIYHEQERTAIQGKLTSMGGMGRIIGVWIGGLLYDGLGMRYDGWGFEKGALFLVAAGVMFLSIFPMRFVPEGGISAGSGRLSPKQAENGPDASLGLFSLFLMAMVFINFGKNSVALIQTQYFVLESGLNVSSRVLSYIVNTQSAAMVITGLISGWISKKMGDANALLAGALVGTVSLVILAVSMDIRLIYFSNVLRGISDALVMAASYTLASILIPAEKRGKRFGMFNATFFLSWGIGATLVTGPIIDLLISRGNPQVYAYQVSFMAAAALTLAGVLIQGVLMMVMRMRKMCAS